MEEKMNFPALTSSTHFQPTAEHFQFLFLSIQKIAEEIENIKHEMINLHYPSPYFTRQEAIDYLRLGRKKFWEMECNGEISVYYLGDTTSSKMKRYKREELDRILTRAPIYTIKL